MERKMQDNTGEEAKVAGRELAEADRRQFLAAVGKFSIATPPAITLLLSTSLTSKAIAMSGGRGGDGYGGGYGGGGNGGGQSLLQQLLNFLDRII
jgi:hypothetical protein